jgi:hypothetical protein
MRPCSWASAPNCSPLAIGAGGKVGSVEVARDPEIRALRAANKRLAQGLDILKSLGHLRTADLVSTYRNIAQRASQVLVRQLCQVLRVASAAYYPTPSSAASRS